jgi:hypothetical protein
VGPALMLAMVAAMAGLVAALFAGAGVAAGLLICSLSGSAAILAGALWVGYRHEIRRRGEKQVSA